VLIGNWLFVRHEEFKLLSLIVDLFCVFETHLHFGTERTDTRKKRLQVLL